MVKVCFCNSRSGRNFAAYTSSFSSGGNWDIFKRRVIHYWNMLPIDVKEASNSINVLNYYKQNNIRKGNMNGYWDLSQEIFRRL